MAPSWGEVFYRACATIAGLVVVIAAINFLYHASHDEPMIPVAPLLLAGAIWRIGLSCRSVSIARMN